MGLMALFPPVLAGGVGRDWSYRIAVQENHGLRAGWAEKSMSQPLAVVFLPAVGGFLPWRGQLWRRTPTLEGHSQGWLGTAHGHAWQHSSKRKTPSEGVLGKYRMARVGVGVGVGAGVVATAVIEYIDIM